MKSYDKLDIVYTYVIQLVMIFDAIISSKRPGFFVKLVMLTINFWFFSYERSNNLINKYKIDLKRIEYPVFLLFRLLVYVPQKVPCLL